MQQRATYIKFLSNNDRQILLHKFSHTVKQTVCVCFYVLQRKKNLALEINAREEFSGIFFFLWNIISTFTDYVCLVKCMWTMMNRSTHSTHYYRMKGPGSRFGIWIPSKKKRKIESLKKKMEDRV